MNNCHHVTVNQQLPPGNSQRTTATMEGANEQVNVTMDICQRAVLPKQLSATEQPTLGQFSEHPSAASWQRSVVSSTERQTYLEPCHDSGNELRSERRSDGGDDFPFVTPGQRAEGRRPVAGVVITRHVGFESIGLECGAGTFGISAEFRCEFYLKQVHENDKGA